MSTDVHTLSGAYALDALDPTEAQSFRRHLEDCPACGQEVRELQVVAARLGATESVPPSARLRARVLAAADRTPQLPPLAESSTSSHQRPLPRRWMPRLAAAAAAVLLVGGGAVGVRSLLDSQEDRPLSAAASRVFEAEDARTLTTRTSNGGQVTLAVSPNLRQVAVDTRELPRLEPDQTYQLWTVVKDVPSNAGLLEDPTQGATVTMVLDGTRLAITVEPEGGSQRPTTEPIVALDPAAV